MTSAVHGEVATEAPLHARSARRTAKIVPNIGRSGTDVRMRRGSVLFLGAVAGAGALLRADLHPALCALVAIPFFFGSHLAFQGLYKT